jgi:hypothetical protein
MTDPAAHLSLVQHFKEPVERRRAERGGDLGQKSIVKRTESSRSQTCLEFSEFWSAGGCACDISVPHWRRPPARVSFNGSLSSFFLISARLRGDTFQKTEDYLQELLVVKRNALSLFKVAASYCFILD